VDVIRNGAPHGFKDDAMLRGVGAAAEKSAEGLPVQMHPAPARRIACVVEGAGARGAQVLPAP
jgi:hypothetical protein